MALQSYSLLVYVTRNIIPENWRRYRQKANQKAGSVVNDSKGRKQDKRNGEDPAPGGRVLIWLCRVDLEDLEVVVGGSYRRVKYTDVW